MTIYIDNDDYMAVCDDNLLGYIGETNARTIEVEHPAVEGADTYRLRFEYSDDVIYDVPIADGKVTVTASLLRLTGYVEVQWLATKATGSSYELVAKSNKLKLAIEDSSGDSGAIPTPETALTALDKISAQMEQSSENVEKAETAQKAAEESCEKALTAETNAAAAAETAQTAASNAASSASEAQTAAETAQKAAEEAAAVGGASDEQIAAAVNTYMTENPIETGDVSQEELDALSDVVNNKLNKPDTDGTAGQVLQSNGDGTAEWKDISTDTDELDELIKAVGENWQEFASVNGTNTFAVECAQNDTISIEIKSDNLTSVGFYRVILMYDTGVIKNLGQFSEFPFSAETVCTQDINTVSVFTSGVNSDAKLYIKTTVANDGTLSGDVYGNKKAINAIEETLDVEINNTHTNIYGDTFDSLPARLKNAETVFKTGKTEYVLTGETLLGQYRTTDETLNTQTNYYGCTQDVQTYREGTVLQLAGVFWVQYWNLDSDGSWVFADSYAFSIPYGETVTDVHEYLLESGYDGFTISATAFSTNEMFSDTNRFNDVVKVYYDAPSYNAADVASLKERTDKLINRTGQYICGSADDNLLKYRNLDSELGFWGAWFDKEIDGTAYKMTIYPGSEIMFRVSGTSSVTFNFLSLSDDTAYVAVSVDGGGFERLLITEATIAFDDTDEHIVRCVMDGLYDGSSAKWTEDNGFVFKDLTIDDGAVLTGICPDNPTILFVGDSITEGCHVLSSDLTSASCSAYQAYPAACARKMDAKDYRLGHGGLGVAFSLSNKPTIPQMVDYMTSNQKQLDINPDAIVVHAGTNDISYGKLDQATFEAAYRSMIKRLSIKYPRIPMYLVIPTNGANSTAIVTAIKNVCNDYAICTLVDALSAKDSVSFTDRLHPDAAGSAALGDLVADVILHGN